MNKEINIALVSTPNHYLKFVATTIESIYRNKNKKYNYNLYIFTTWKISDLDREKLNNNYDTNFHIKLIEIDEKSAFFQYKNLKEKDYIVYDRLILWDYLDTIDKLLYVDCDIIVNWDISELYEIDLCDNVIWAARDSINRSNYNKNYIDKYFNAWILLINLKLWNQEQIWKKILNDINNNEQKYAFHDQDGLNYVLKNRWKEISPKWNWLQTCIFFKNTQYSQDQYYDVKHPIIYHYAGWHYRPWWKRFCVHPNQIKYFKYVFKTNYRSYKDILLFIWRILTWNIFVRTIYKILQQCFWIKKFIKKQDKCNSY